MDPYRARSGARYAGLAILLVVGIAFAFMEKTLVSLRLEQGTRSTWLGTGNGSPAPELDARVAAIELGSGWRGAEAGDLDGDGTEDLLLCISPGPEGRTDALERVVVIAPRPHGRVALLFDSRWANSIAGIGSAVLWRPVRLGLFDIRLEGIDFQGAPVGTQLEVSWVAGERSFRQHVARVDDRRIALYN